MEGDADLRACLDRWRVNLGSTKQADRVDVALFIGANAIKADPLSATEQNSVEGITYTLTYLMSSIEPL